MLEDEIVACPFCDKELSVKVMRIGKKPTYFVSDSCPNCKTNADEISKKLNKSTRSSKIKTERSYLKVDPRG